MLLVKPDTNLSSSGIELINQQLDEFSNQITDAIARADWETLDQLLASRQSYLADMLAQPEAERYQDILHKRIVEILAEDHVALSTIQEQQQKLIELHLLTEQGIRAIKAYGG